MLDGLRADRPQPAAEWWIRTTSKHMGVALAQVLGCFTGAGLMLWHWFSTGWNVRTDELAGASGGLPDATMDAFTPVRGVLIPTIALLLLALGGALGQVVFAGRVGKSLACAAGWTLALLAPLHAVEAWLVHRTAGPDPGPERLWLQGVAFVGYALLPAAGIVSMVAAVTALARMSDTIVYRRRLRRPGNHHPLLAAWRSAPEQPGDRAHWYDGTALPPREPGTLGICLSGGGIRSATFGLGALQALQEPGTGADHTGELSRAQYLVAVSGGAYTAGAFQLATQPPVHDEGARPVAVTGAQNLFRPGSPEFDHLRRHSAYIADGFREWAVATLVVLRGALFSMLFLAAVALVAGRWVGLLYTEAGRSADFTSPGQPLWGAVLATAVVAGVAVLMWLGSLWTGARPAEPHWRVAVRGVLRRAAVLTCVPLTVLVVLGAFVPLIAWISWRLIETAPGESSETANVALGAAGGGLTAAAGIAMTVIGLLHRHSVTVAKATRSIAKSTAGVWTRLGDTGRRAAQWLAVYAGLAVVAAVYLIVFGISAYTTAAHPADFRQPVNWGAPNWVLPANNVLTFVATGVLVVVYAVLDETAVGLHPFYRRRLANAFAVRRVMPSWERGDAPHYEAEPYDRDERTDLETYGAPPGPGFPRVILCAAVHCSDPDRTPPGRHVLPFTFSSDAVGGPQFGWYRPQALRPLVPQRLGGDLTVQTAMAVSGAAFASATGTFRGAANVVLALTNARLGVWYPNPAAFSDHGRDWWRARPPKIRRLSYLVREIFGWYPKSNPLVFVSDGGRYDNLGLVELLRHRCREIYCFDAAAGDQAFAQSVAKSVTLARDELGVTVDLDDPDRARPGAPAGAGGPPDGAGPPADLAGRLAATPVMTGVVTYPPLAPGQEETTGILVIGRAVLDANAPWEVLRHAAAHPSFPHDVTGDQWFDDAKFDAYSTLGRHVGDVAREEMLRRRSERDEHRGVRRR